MAGGHVVPGKGPQPKGQGANPLAFVPLFTPAEPEPLGPARGNPDPFAFGAARPSVAQLEEQLTEFSDQIYAARADPEQEFVHVHVLDELKKMIGHCKVNKIPPPAGAKEAIGDLEKTVVGYARTLLCCALVLRCRQLQLQASGLACYVFALCNCQTPTKILIIAQLAMTLCLSLSHIQVNDC